MITLGDLTNYVLDTNPALTAQLKVPFAYNSLLEFLQIIAAHYNLQPPKSGEKLANVSSRLLSEIPKRVKK